MLVLSALLQLASCSTYCFHFQHLIIHLLLGSVMFAFSDYTFTLLHILISICHSQQFFFMSCCTRVTSWWVFCDITVSLNHSQILPNAGWNAFWIFFSLSNTWLVELLEGCSTVVTMSISMHRVHPRREVLHNDEIIKGLSWCSKSILVESSCFCEDGCFLFFLWSCHAVNLNC